MAIAPIDLQTMYSQMNNVAKTVANQQQGTQLVNAMQEAKIVRQNLENSAQVHKAADNEAKSGQVKADGHGSSNQEGFDKKQRKSDQEQSDKENVIRESFLGQHIDITR